MFKTQTYKKSQELIDTYEEFHKSIMERFELLDAMLKEINRELEYLHTQIQKVEK